MKENKYYFPEVHPITPKTYLFSDSHFNHENIATYCLRPANFTDLIIDRWNRTIREEDIVIHLGDVAIGHVRNVEEIIRGLKGRKILIRGNHDRKKSCQYWMGIGFDFCCDSMIYRDCWLTHEPAKRLPRHTSLNIHGHLHNIWHGFNKNKSVPASEEESIRRGGSLEFSWQRLFACEYTNYTPVEMEKFLSHPDRYFARGVNENTPKTLDNR